MRSLIDRLKEHRRAIEESYNAQRGKETSSSRMVRALCSALLSDFDSNFPEILFTRDRAYWEKLVKKYAHPGPGCPICRSVMYVKHSMNGGSFYGCSLYPECTGARGSATGTPTINEGMKLYLLQREQEEGLDNTEDERFKRLILDG